MPVFHPDPPHPPASFQGLRKVLDAFRTLPPETRVFTGVQLPAGPACPGGLGLDVLVVDPELGLVLVAVPPDGAEPRKGHWVCPDAAGALAAMAASPADLLAAQQDALFKFLKGMDLAFVPRITQVLALPLLPLEPGRALGPNLPACRLLTEEKLKNPFISMRLAVTGGKPWTEWSTTPLAGQFGIGGETMARLTKALTPVVRPRR